MIFMSASKKSYFLEVAVVLGLVGFYASSPFELGFLFKSSQFSSSYSLS